MVGLKDARADLVGKDLQEGDCVPDASEIGWDAHPCEEGVPLFTRCVVFA